MTGPVSGAMDASEGCAPSGRSRMRSRLLAFAGAVIVLLTSMAFQWSVHPRPIEDTDITKLVAPDTCSYFRLAQHLADEKANVYLRTPGLPVCLRVTAWWIGVDFDKVLVPGRKWEEVSDDGKRVIRAAMRVFDFMGCLLPVVIYGAVLLLCAMPWLAVLASFAYMADIASVCSQSVLMTEFPATFWTWISLAATVGMFRRPTVSTACLAGLAAGWAAWIRPDCLLLGALAFPLLAGMLWWNRSVFPWRRATLVCSVFFLVFSSLVGACCLHNKAATGHFFYSMGLAFTRQSLVVKTIAEAPDITDDPEVAVMQRHYREALNSGAKNAWLPWSLGKKVTDELGGDQYYYRQLTVRTILAAIRLNPRQFLANAEDRYWWAWRNPYNFIYNPEAQQNAPTAPLFRNFCRVDGRMIFGEWSHTAFVAFWALAFIVFRRTWQRFLLVYFAAHVFLKFVVCVGVDDDAPLRHTMSVRTWINALSLLGAGLSVQMIVLSLHRLAAFSFGPMPMPAENQALPAQPLLPRLHGAVRWTAGTARRAKIPALILLCLLLAGAAGIGWVWRADARWRGAYRSVARLMSSGASANDVVLHCPPESWPEGAWVNRLQAPLNRALEPEWVVAPALKGKLRQFSAGTMAAVDGYARQYPNASFWVLQDFGACSGQAENAACGTFAGAMTKRHGDPAVFQTLRLWRIDEPTVNLIQDGGFEREEGAAARPGEGAVITGADEAHAGQHALRFDGPGTARLCLPALPPPGPDSPRTYTLSLMTRYKSIVGRPPKSGKTAKVVIAAFDGHGHLSKNAQGSPLGWRNPVVFSGTKEQWHKITVTLDREADLPPAGEQACVVLGNFGGTGTIWFDNVQFEAKDHATAFVDGERAPWPDITEKPSAAPAGESPGNSK